MHTNPDKLNLEMRTATYRDRGALQRFKCTTASAVVVYDGIKPQVVQPTDSEFELPVQDAITDYKPDPRNVRRIERLGFLDKELVTVMLAMEIERGVAYELVYAVSVTWRGTGAADVMVKDMFRQLAPLSPGPDIEVFARIHRDNRRSQALASRHGLEYVRPDPEEPWHEQWRGLVVPERYTA